MPQPKDDFERQAPSLLQGNLWRKYLSSRKNKPEPLEQTLKAFLKEPLEVDKAFPEVSSQLLATLPVTEQAFKAYEKLRASIQKLKKLTWHSYLEAYLTDVAHQLSQLEQMLKEFGELGNKVATTQAGSTKLSDALLCYQENTDQALPEFPTYQSFVKDAKDEHYILLVNFLKKSQEVETLFTDLVLINKAFVNELSALSILKNEIYLSQQLSNTALLFLLGFDDESVLKLVEDKGHYFVHPSTLLKKFSAENWLFCIEHSIGFKEATLIEALCKPNLDLLAIFPRSLAITLAKSNPKYETPVLLNSQCVTDMCDDDFVTIAFALTDHQIQFLQNNSIKSKTTMQRLLAILNDNDKRKVIFTSEQPRYKLFNETWARAFLDNAKAWMLDAQFIQGLSDEAFKECFIYASQYSFQEIIVKQPLFLKRLETLDSESLIAIFEASKGKMPSCGENLLSQPTLSNKLSTDELLCRGLMLLSEKHSIEKYRKQNPVLDKRLTPAVIIQLASKSTIFAAYIEKNAEMLQRFTANDFYLYIMSQPHSTHMIKHILSKREVLETLSIEQLLQIKDKPAYLLAIGTQDAIALEIERRRISQDTVTSTAISVDRHLEQNNPVSKGNFIKKSDHYSMNTQSNSNNWYLQLSQIILHTLSIGLVLGLGAAFFFHAPFIAITALNAALLLSLLITFGTLLVPFIQTCTSDQETTPQAAQTNTANQIIQPTLNKIDKHFPHPATRQRHLGTAKGSSDELPPGVVSATPTFSHLSRPTHQS